MADDNNICLNPDKIGSLNLYCDACGFYPIVPVHGHFVCPACQHQTRCCEGAPADE